MEHLGCRTTIVFRPGHAFTLVWVGERPNDFVPIECTAITPFAVGERAPSPSRRPSKWPRRTSSSSATSYRLNVQEYQRQGFHAPELPGFDIEKIKTILAQRSASGPPATELAQAGGDNGQPAANSGRRQ